MARRGDHHEQIFVAKLERLLLGAASIDHDLSVLLGDDRGRRGQAGRIWAEQKLRAVLVDQPRIELLHPVADRLIVVADEVHFIAFAAGFDAAGGVDPVAPHFVAAHEPERVDIERTGLRGSKADGDGVFGEGGVGGPCEGRGDQKGKRKQPFHR